jgi:hypothetical protein
MFWAELPVFVCSQPTPGVYYMIQIVSKYELENRTSTTTYWKPRNKHARSNHNRFCMRLTWFETEIVRVKRNLLDNSMRKYVTSLNGNKRSKAVQKVYNSRIKRYARLTLRV